MQTEQECALGELFLTFGFTQFALVFGIIVDGTPSEASSYLALLVFYFPVGVGFSVNFIKKGFEIVPIIHGEDFVHDSATTFVKRTGKPIFVPEGVGYHGDPCFGEFGGHGADNFIRGLPSGRDEESCFTSFFVGFFLSVVAFMILQDGTFQGLGAFTNVLRTGIS